MEDNFEDERPRSPEEQRSMISREARNGCAQVLLLNSDQDKVFEEHLRMKCDGAFTEAEAVRKVRRSLDNLNKEKNPQFKKGYKFLVIDMTDFP